MFLDNYSRTINCTLLPFGQLFLIRTTVRDWLPQNKAQAFSEMFSLFLKIENHTQQIFHPGEEMNIASHDN